MVLLRNLRRRNSQGGSSKVAHGVPYDCHIQRDATSGAVTGYNSFDCYTFRPWVHTDGSLDSAKYDKECVDAGGNTGNAPASRTMYHPEDLHLHVHQANVALRNPLQRAITEE